jgi:hypothetical protein
MSHVWKILRTNIKGKCSRRRPRSRRKQQVGKDVTQNERRTQEETEETELSEDKRQMEKLD